MPPKNYQKLMNDFIAQQHARQETATPPLTSDSPAFMLHSQSPPLSDDSSPLIDYTTYNPYAAKMDGQFEQLNLMNYPMMNDQVYNPIPLRQEPASPTGPQQWELELESMFYNNGCNNPVGFIDMDNAALELEETFTNLSSPQFIPHPITRPMTSFIDAEHHNQEHFTLLQEPFIYPIDSFNFSPAPPRPASTPAYNTTFHCMPSFCETVDENSTDEAVKRYKCPKPLCSKVYKNVNGLKYHLERGNCELDTSSGPKSPSATSTEYGVGRDIRVTGRPFVCKIPACSRRYKNLNGLKYHARVSHPELDFVKHIKGDYTSRMAYKDHQAEIIC